MEDNTETLLWPIYYLEDYELLHMKTVIECLIIPLSWAADFRREGGLMEFLLRYFVFLREGNREGNNIFSNIDTT